MTNTSKKGRNPHPFEGAPVSAVLRVQAGNYVTFTEPLLGAAGWPAPSECLAFRLPSGAIQLDRIDGPLGGKLAELSRLLAHHGELAAHEPGDILVQAARIVARTFRIRITETRKVTLPEPLRLLGVLPSYSPNGESHVEVLAMRGRIEIWTASAAPPAETDGTLVGVIDHAIAVLSG